MSSIVSHMVPGKRANLMERTAPLCVWNRVRGGKEKREILLSFQTSINTAGIEQLWFQRPIIYHRCQFMLHSGIVLHCYILQSEHYSIFLKPWVPPTLLGLELCRLTRYYINANQWVNSDERASFNWRNLATVINRGWPEHTNMRHFNWHWFSLHLWLPPCDTVQV